MRLLLVEDEQSLSETIIEYLETEGHFCEPAYNFQTALSLINQNDYDCAIVDINLPDGSGLDLIRNIKEKQKTLGIIIISGRDSTEDRIKGLNIGADMYLTKPFHLAELNAHLNSINRRVNFNGSQTIEFDNIVVYPEEHRVFVDKKELTLTRKEFEILLFFIANQNKVISKVSLAELIWGDFSSSPSSLDFVYTHIKNLRKKIINKGGSDYIKTVYGVGYKWML